MNDSEITLNARQALGGAPAAREASDGGSETRPSRLPPGPKPSGPKPWRWIALLVAVVAAGWGWRHFTAPSAEPDAAQTAQDQGGGKRGRGGDRGVSQPVGVATADLRDLNVVIGALGTVTPIATVTVVSQISGYLQQVAFTEGQHVKNGDFLAQIDARPYEALKKQYEGQLARDQGLLDQAKADLIRYQGLLKQNSIARQTAENQIYVVQQNEGTVRSDQAQIDAQALNIAYSHIVSPVDGRVGLRLVDAGNYIQAGSSTGIAVITQLQPISVLFSVPEDALVKILPKIRDGARLTAVAYDRANTHLLATGAVTVLDNQVDTTTGMVKLRAQFENKDEALFPNQFVNIRLLVDTLQNVVAAPVSAVQHGAPGDYAYVVGADGKASVRVLKLGQTDGDYVQIVSGLSAGDVVVVDGADRLHEGSDTNVVSIDGSAKEADASAPNSVAAPVGAMPGDPSQRRKRSNGANGNGASANGGQ